MKDIFDISPRMSSFDNSYLLKCTKKQRRVWEARADESGMSLAAWIRKNLDDGAVYYTQVQRRS